LRSRARRPKSILYDVPSFENGATTNYTKLPVTPWNPWAACFRTQLMTLASL
jgi:hypothetical protein